MNMKVRKSVIAFLMATTMVGSTAVPAMADTATVTVSIKTTGLTGALQKTADYILPETSITVSKDGDAKVTAMDALLQAVGEGTQVDVTRNKYFKDNGASNSRTRGDYFKLEKLTDTEKALGLAENSTWNNTVHFENYISEKDYNNYSGWMCIINNASPYDGVDSVVSTGDKICMDFSMMMGLDQGQDSYMQNSNGDWVQVKAW